MAYRSLVLSVHQLVDFLLRVGDIDDRVYNQETMQMGTILHGTYQKKQGIDYLSEVALSEVFERPKGRISLQGRADGILLGGRYPIIDEIKSTVEELDAFASEQHEWHEGQALCYALMYLHQKGGQEAGVRLTYLSQITSEQKVIETEYTLEQIEKRVYGYMDAYLDFHDALYEHRRKRDESAKALSFPFSSFRPGQRELAKYCYGIAQHGGLLFAEAPTGIGKTMSTLYPFVKSFHEGRVDKIFYFTAKTTGGLSAYQAIGELYGAGLVGWDSFLLAKEKICFSPGHACNPDDCPFAKGYYTKLKSTILKAIERGNRFDSVEISSICRAEGICPFEFQLDLSLFSDFVIGDYNYFFDPMVHLQRYFDPMVDTSAFLVLVDEAHNLVDRGMGMFSAELQSSSCRFAKKAMKLKAYGSIKRSLTKLENAIEGCLGPEEDYAVLEGLPEGVLKAIESLKRATQKAGKDGLNLRVSEDLRGLSRESNKLLKLLEGYPNESYRFYAERSYGSVAFHMTCLDPSPYLEKSLRSVKGAAVFSATLSPIDFYMDAITGKKDYPFLLLPSPFPKENFHLMLAPKVSVRYKDREKSLSEVARYLQAFVGAKKGNYFLYFPSYEYLEKIRPYLDFPKANILIQDRAMTPDERTAFLEEFPPSPSVTTVGLLVLGGAFSEGVDLVSDRLIGVALVGIGLPQIGKENDLIRDYREARSGNGFDYAYKDPGMNKVMQAVGRLIRSETDIGAALLIDDRYLRDEYRDLFLRVWSDYEVVTSPEDVSESLSSFYRKS